MAHQSDLIAQDIEAYLQAHQNKSLLRFITCGSVDDGKSSLIGRLLYESQMLFEDQLAALETDSRKVGTRGDELDYALLLDGLAAEREQGITIDVAYRFFSTDRRKFIVADTPGHEQYTRNMVTGASTADLAIILIDARKGVLVQTRRHSMLVALIGIRHVVLAINKMDLIDYSEARFREIEAEYRAFAAPLGLHEIVAIPLSAVRGDNVIEPQGNTPWYTGPSLMPYLETVELDETRAQASPFRLPVQWVNRPDLDFRGFAGTIAGGQIAPGTSIRVMPSGRTSVVSRIVTFDGDLDCAVAQQAVTLTLADEIDISRGDLICRADEPASVGDELSATLVWMADEALLPGRSYIMKIGARTVAARIISIAYRINIDTQEQVATQQLALNEIGLCTLNVDRPIAFDPYEENRETGGFILIDRLANTTVAAGLIRSGHQRRSGEQSGVVDARARARALGQTPVLIWLSTDATRVGAARTLANALEQGLYAAGYRTMLVDGTDQGEERQRVDANQQAAHGSAASVDLLSCTRLLTDAGLIVIAIAPAPDAAQSPAPGTDGEAPARLWIQVEADSTAAGTQDRVLAWVQQSQSETK